MTMRRRVLLGVAALVVGLMLPGCRLVAAASGRNDAYVSVYNDGVALHESKQYDSAAERFAKAATVVTDEPRRSAALYNLGVALYRRGDLRGSLDAFRSALLLNPADEDSRYNYAYVKARFARDSRQLQSPPASLSDATALELLDRLGAPVPVRRLPRAGSRPDRDW